MAWAAQNLVVALIVGACAVYAMWVLMPAVARRVLAAATSRLPLPARLAAALRRTTQVVGGCACEGCDRAAPKPAAAATHTVTFHPRTRR